MFQVVFVVLALPAASIHLAFSKHRRSSRYVRANARTRRPHFLK